MQVNGNYSLQPIGFQGTQANSTEPKVKLDLPNDTFELSSDRNLSSKTKEEKQEIMQKARTKAAGWSILFWLFDTLYYGLRSDEKVAKQFDLDADKDKGFIKNIKRQQMLCTLPSLIPGFGIIPGLICWLYNKNLDSSKLDVGTEAAS